MVLYASNYFFFFAFHVTVGVGEGGGFKKISRQHSPPYWQQCSIQPAAARGGDLHDKPEQPQSGTRRQQEAFQCEEAEFHSYTAARTACWLITYTWAFLKIFYLMITLDENKSLDLKISYTENIYSTKYLNTTLVSTNDSNLHQWKFNSSHQ